MKKDGQKVSLVSLEGNLKQFKDEFILAGPRQVIIGAYRKLLEEAVTRIQGRSWTSGLLSEVRVGPRPTRTYFS